MALYEPADFVIGRSLLNLNYAYVSTTVIWVYDYIITFDDELAYLRKSTWGKVKILYLMCRYLPFVLLAADTYQVLQPALPLSQCQTYFQINSWLEGITLMAAEWMFILRTSLPSVPLEMTVISQAILIPVIYILTSFGNSVTISEPPIPNITSCYNVGESRIIVVAYVLLVVAEFEILSFTLYRSIKHYRSLTNDNHLLNILIQHNIFYFICGLFFSLFVILTIALLPSNDMSSSSTSPSTQDIWKWTFTKEATAPCFIRDALSMKESNTGDADFYWLGHIPCRKVIIVGIVVGIQDYEKRTLYTIDDSTAVIDCVLRHPLPPKAPTNTDASRSIQNPKWEAKSLIPPAPPTPVTAIGYPVQVIGKVSRFYDTRQIVVESIVAELHKSRYSVPKPFEIPAPLAVSSCETGSEELGNWHERRQPAAASTSASGTGIPAPRTPLKRPAHDHAPSSPLTDSTTSAPSSPIKHGSTRPRVPLDQTPKARTVYTTDNMTPRASTLNDSAPDRPAFTLSHLRRVPELALLACRVVHAERKRRARAERDTEKDKAMQTQKTSSNNTHGPLSKALAHSRTRTKPTDVPRVKMKRLFSWAVLKLYEEGSIVLWDQPLTPVAVSGSRPPGSGDTSGLWKTLNNTANCSSANSSVFSTANNTMFSSTGASSSKFVMSEEDAYLSDPPMYEEDEAYVSVTPTLLAAPVRKIMRAKGMRGKSVKVGAEEITRCLRREDARWARIGAWAVEETMEMILGERK
ncbi:hypothetical protein EV424DRAFT_1540632 [Suillus variegatus]|nr:hypothetical protein EV424DRAFT_1540632 [Suillus variegatus]